MFWKLVVLLVGVGYRETIQYLGYKYNIFWGSQPRNVSPKHRWVDIVGRCHDAKVVDKTVR